MCMVAYPFFTMVAESTGRLVRLQGTVAQAQVLRRIWDQIGERATVTRAAQRVLRSFADWKVLDYVEEPGIYKARPTRRIADPDLAAWMIEASLMREDRSILPPNAPDRPFDIPVFARAGIRRPDRKTKPIRDRPARAR